MSFAESFLATHQDRLTMNFTFTNLIIQQWIRTLLIPFIVV